MTKILKKTLLLIILMLFFIGLSTISATDSNTQKNVISTDTVATNNIDNNITNPISKIDNNNIKKQNNAINNYYKNKSEYYEVNNYEVFSQDQLNENNMKHVYRWTNEIETATENNNLFTNMTSNSKPIYKNNSIKNDNNTDERIKTYLRIYAEPNPVILGESVDIFTAIDLDRNMPYEYAEELNNMTSGKYQGILYVNNTPYKNSYIQNLGFGFLYENIWKNVSLSIAFIGNEKYTESIATVDLKILIPTRIQAEDTINLELNEHLTSISVIDKTNDILDKATIKVYENDVFISNLSDFSLTSYGEHKLKLVFEGGILSDGNTYLASEKEITVSAKKRANISLNFNEEYRLGETVDINVLIKDKKNAVISGLNVDIYCNDKHITSSITNFDGKINYPYSPTTEGIYRITVKLNDEIYIANDTTNTFTVLQPPKEYSLKIITKNFTIGEIATIKANIYFGNEFEKELVTNLIKGKVIFKVNGKTLKDENGKVIYAKVVNGTATLENYEVPETWNKKCIILEAVYSGSTQCDALRSTKEELTIKKVITPTITTENVNTIAGSKVTLKATITGLEDITKNTKVVFKINGKSVKDENGKVIYVKVVNGEVSVEYVIPETYKAKNYVLTAIYLAANYDRIEDSKTLTISNIY